MAIQATLEQFKAAFADRSADEIRAELVRDHGLDLPQNLKRDALLGRAFKALCVQPEGEDAVPAETPADVTPAPSGKVYEVRCHGVQSRPRCGRLFTQGWTDVTEGELTADEWALLRSDQRIMIREKA